MLKLSPAPADLIVVEHSAGPSSGVAPAYTRGSSALPPAGTDFSGVEYEGFEVDDEDEPAADEPMVQAVGPPLLETDE
jgi:hypothetical protein